MNNYDVLGFLKLQQNDIDDALSEADTVKEIFAEPNPEGLSEIKIKAIYAGAAMHIQSFYTAIELVIKNTLQKIDGHIAEGDGWHAQLLKQASRSNDHRNALISADTFNDFSELRRFRHVVRNLYGTALDEKRVIEIAEVTQRAKSSFIEDWNTFKSNFEDKNDLSSQTTIKIKK